MALRVEKVGKRFGARVVLRDVSFLVPPASVLGVVGRNGSGKSTLLRLIAGLTTPSRGIVLWGEASTRDRCALFAPDAPLYRELTCLENLRFWTNHNDLCALRAHLAAFALGDRAGDYAGDLSSGLRARLGVCVAAWHAEHGRPILLLDEPTANLDDAGRALIANTIQTHKERGGVVLVATNDARDLAFCDATFEIPAI